MGEDRLAQIGLWLPIRQGNDPGCIELERFARRAELLAEGDTFPVQAFRAGAAYALQFHPEVTHATICRWTVRGHERTFLPGAKRRPTHFADRAVYDPAGRVWLAAFLDRWLG